MRRASNPGKNPISRKHRKRLLTAAAIIGAVTALTGTAWVLIRELTEEITESGTGPDIFRYYLIGGLLLALALLMFIPGRKK